jgi:hypothetical protein
MSEQNNHPQPVPGQDISDYPVSVTVFMTAEGRDERDAGHNAELAVQQTILAGDTILVHTPAGGTRTVHIAGTLDTRTAATSGYLTIRPTARAYRELR